jgi:hypothetical protein
MASLTLPPVVPSAVTLVAANSAARARVAMIRQLDRRCGYSSFNRRASATASIGLEIRGVLDERLEHADQRSGGQADQLASAVLFEVVPVNAEPRKSASDRNALFQSATVNVEYDAPPSSITKQIHYSLE